MYQGQVDYPAVSHQGHQEPWQGRLEDTAWEVNFASTPDLDWAAMQACSGLCLTMQFLFLLVICKGRLKWIFSYSLCLAHSRHLTNAPLSSPVPFCSRSKEGVLVSMVTCCWMTSFRPVVTCPVGLSSGPKGQVSPSGGLDWVKEIPSKLARSYWLTFQLPENFGSPSQFAWCCRHSGWMSAPHLGFVMGAGHGFLELYS